MKIENFTINTESRVFIIAELSANHNGSIDTAIETIKAAKRAGADCIKLQTYTADTLTIDCDKEDFLIKGTIWNGKNYYQLYKEAFTPWEWHEDLIKVAKKEGLICFSSPFDKSAVDFLESLNVPAYKIASFEITDIPLIEYVASKGKPIIMSTGIAELDDISLAFLSCYFDLKNTDKKFEEFIEYDGSSSRYIYFYLDYLIEQNKINKIDQVLQNINQLNKPLLIAQSVKWIEEKNYNKLNNLFSCKNEKDIIAEFFYLIANLYSSQGLFKESNFYIILAKYLNPNFTLNSTLLIENYMDTKKYKLVKNELSNIEKDNVIYNWFKVKKNASIIQETKNDDSALKFIKKEYGKIQNPSNKILFDMGNILRNFQDYEGAIEIYSNLIQYSNYSAEEYADLLYKRGTSYERKKDFLKADEDLIESLKIDPDEPYVLNYLGYSWLERSYKIPDAMEMLKEAYSLRENDPYITDSIGWAYYLIKDFVNAKKYLEKAVKLMPYDPIVNDHYGDVLWRLNKKVQARYFWNGVLKLEDTEEELKKEIEKKLVFGL